MYPNSVVGCRLQILCSEKVAAASPQRIPFRFGHQQPTSRFGQSIYSIYKTAVFLLPVTGRNLVFLLMMIFNQFHQISTLWVSITHNTNKKQVESIKNPQGRENLIICPERAPSTAEIHLTIYYFLFYKYHTYRYYLWIYQNKLMRL